MTFQPKSASAFNDTHLRSRHISPQSGMCSFCTEECDGSCEIALAAVLGKQTVYPTNTGNNQVASEKDYPIDFSHFNINGRVFGALGTRPTYEEANIYNVNLAREYGKFNRVKLAMPLILPALIKLNWQDYFAGAAMAGVSCVIGEEARDKDPDLKIENKKVLEFPALGSMLDAFRKYYRGYGQIILQVNVEDDLLGIPEYALLEHGLEGLEFKFGQGAKGTQPVRKLKNRAEALEKQKQGILVFPDPLDPEIIEKDKGGICPNFYVYTRLPLWDEEYLISRIENLREMGIKNFYFKMAGYDRADLERVIRLGSEAQVDMITFDGAGGGSGYSPCKMMNEWSLPTVMLEEAVCDIAEKVKAENRYLPALTITGGFSSEDQVFKALAFGNQNISCVGICRAAMTAAMTGKNIGERIKNADIPKNMKQYGDTVEELFYDLADLRSLYGKEADSFSLGAVGVYSYLNKIDFGLRHFAALNRKFDISYLDQSDLIALTNAAKELLLEQH
ncbi:MAG: FMN-binding glutamate synthase family protein [Clostridiaceae bacterium]|nr:FMN-binding glutamate synthase family protein [Clostridiaceae bacterium]